MTKIENQKYYLEQLHDQVSFLIDACHSYDRGNFKQAKLRSGYIRTIVKDPERKSRTISLLTHLKRKDSMNFYNTGYEAEEPIININLVGIASVPAKSLFDQKRVDHIYLPMLNKSQQIDVRWLTFEQWWKSRIIVYKSENSNIVFTRKSIVLTMAEQDGGHHVDSIEDIDINYYELATATKSLFSNVDTQGNESPIINIHFALVRQIAHELIISLLKEFQFDLDYSATNKYNLNGVSEKEIKQFGVFSEADKCHSVRTKTPYREMHSETFTTPENVAYVRFFF